MALVNQTRHRKIAGGDVKEIVRMTRCNRFEGLLDGSNSLGNRQPQTTVMCIMEQMVLHAEHGTSIVYICASAGACAAGFASPFGIRLIGA